MAYVGITRAEKKLLMTYAESRRIYGEERFNAVSRFVRDIPGELVEEIRARINRPAAPGVTRASASGGSSRRFSTSDQGVDTGFELGQHVSHPKFGEGVILNFEGQGASARVQVNFTSEGTKWLVVSYARLEAI